MGETDVAWKAKWTVRMVKTVGLLKEGTPVDDVETPLPIPACPKGKSLVRALLVRYDTIQWPEIRKLYKAFEECGTSKCPCPEYCNKPDKPAKTNKISLMDNPKDRRIARLCNAANESRD